jgi:predicted porin
MRVALGIVLVSMATLGSALAADLPSKKAPEPAAPPKPSCWTSFSDFLNTSAADCPLQAGPFTAFGTIDAGVTYQEHGQKMDPTYPAGVAYMISKNSGQGRVNFAPNGLSQSTVGVKFKQDLFGDVSAVGAIAAGFNPYSLQFANGPASLYNNSGIALAHQTANGDSSRAGGFWNSYAYLGASSKTLGTLTYGRQTVLSNDWVNTYDPFGGSYAFSLIGFQSSTAQGVGSSETARYNQSLKYFENYNHIHVGGAVQLGGYAQLNGAQSGFQLQLGGDYAGFSIDGIYSHADGAVSLGSLSAGPPPKFPGGKNGDLTATISDNTGWGLAASYVYGPVKGYAGYENIRYANPGTCVGAPCGATKGNSFTDIGGYTTTFSNLTQNAYTNNKVLQVFWVGAKWSVTSQVDLIGGYYHYTQNDYAYLAKDIASCNKGSVNSSKCAGGENVFSAAVDWKPYKRFDVYAGVAASALYGGLANGYTTSTKGLGYTSNIAPTAGLRISF